MPKDYYNTPEQQKVQRHYEQYQNRTYITRYSDKEVQTQGTQGHYKEPEEVCENISEFIGSENLEISRKEEFNKLIENEVSGIFCTNSNLKILKPFGYFCLPTVSMYVRQCCLQVVHASFDRINSFHNSYLLLPFQEKFPKCVHQFFDANQMHKAEQRMRKQLKETELKFLRPGTSNFKILAFFKLTKCMNRNFPNGVRKMLCIGKDMDNGRHKSITIAYQSNFDSHKQLMTTIMTYLQTVKTAFYEKITLLCNNFEDFQRISDIFKDLMERFNSNREISV